tara:strand:+ start:1433 stop:1618 length:186 start_codon:yes stop_codon:yes gene_type:complete
MNKINAKDFYYDWWNNYLTVDRIASDYAIREDQAIELIEQGRIEWNRAADEEKRKATEGQQ